MNKIILVMFVAGMLLLSLASISVQAKDSNGSELRDDRVSANEDSDNGSDDLEDSSEDVEDADEVRESNKSEVKDGSETEDESDNESEVETEFESEGNKSKFKEKVKLKIGEDEFESELEYEEQNEGNETKIKVKLSNGFKEIKVMPSTASARALEVLGAKCEERNCSIELKEVGTGNETKAAYEVKAQKEVKVLGLFKAKMQVEAQIDAENGEVIKQKKAWWAFLAAEEDVSEEVVSEENVSV